MTFLQINFNDEENKIIYEYQMSKSLRAKQDAVKGIIRDFQKCKEIIDKMKGGYE